MNGREKVEAAFSQEGSPEFAVMIPYEGIYVRDHWSQLTRFPWWFAFSPNLDERIACLSEIIPAVGQDFLEFYDCPDLHYRQTYRLEVRSRGVFLVDQRNGTAQELQPPVIGGWEIIEQGYSGHVDHLPVTAQEIDQRLPPCEPFDRARFEATGKADLARWQVATFGQDHYPLGGTSSPFWNGFFLWGFEGLMAMTAEKPDLVRYACDRSLAYSLQKVHESAAMGAAGIWIEDCLTDMISPEAFRELNLPYVRAIVEEIRSLGMHSIYYFCGNPAKKLHLLLETGADALALEESKKGFKIDIAEVAEEVQGRCALLGNLDAIHLLPNASEEELKAEIARQVAAGRRNRNRFVMSLGSPVTPGTSPQRVRDYCNWARELGGRPATA